MSRQTYVQLEFGRFNGEHDVIAFKERVAQGVKK